MEVSNKFIEELLELQKQDIKLAMLISKYNIKLKKSNKNDVRDCLDYFKEKFFEIYNENYIVNVKEITNLKRFLSIEDKKKFKEMVDYVFSDNMKIEFLRDKIITISLLLSCANSILANLNNKKGIENKNDTTEFEF